MRILFDHNVDRRFRLHLSGHEIKTTRMMKWDLFENGDLLRVAADAGFDALLSVDKKMQHQQNVNTLPLPVIVIDCISNALPSLISFAPTILKLLESKLDRSFYLVKSDGTIVQFGKQLS